MEHDDAADDWPLWLSPLQCVVCSTTDDIAAYAEEVCTRARELGLKVTTDVRNENIRDKVREHISAKVPVVFVVGHRERDERTVILHPLGSSDSRTYPLDEALALLVAEAHPPDLER
jgi:threonyl-tRNA synthetase